MPFPVVRVTSNLRHECWFLRDVVWKLELQFWSLLLPVGQVLVDVVLMASKCTLTAMMAHFRSLFDSGRLLVTKEDKLNSGSFHTLVLTKLTRIELRYAC